jgi:hypothetical protein
MPRFRRSGSPSLEPRKKAVVQNSVTLQLLQAMLLSSLAHFSKRIRGRFGVGEVEEVTHVAAQQRMQRRGDR